MLIRIASSETPMTQGAFLPLRKPSPTVRRLEARQRIAVALKPSSIIRKFPNADKDLRRLIVSAIVILDNSFTHTWSNSLYEPSS